MIELIIVFCIATIALSGLVNYLPLGKPSHRLIIGTALHVVASAAGIVTSVVRLISPVGGQSEMLGEFGDYLRIDAISVFFLIPIFFVTASASVYGSEYCLHHPYQPKRRSIQLYFALISVALLTIASSRHIYLFLGAWEVMALSAFMLVSTEDEKPEIRGAAWTYILATHASTLCLFGLFGLLISISGSPFLDQISAGAASTAQVCSLFALAFVAFGLKAGVYPMHFWLPPAHAAAPSHVSAIMSGVLIKIGVYGIVRILWVLPSLPAWWGYVIICFGVISAVLGVVHAIGQHDLKRLLAYHSVENIGIIVMGIGLSVLGTAVGSPLLTTLGMAAGLLHVWNHALFKGLLFLSAGAVIHSAKTRHIDALGGLGKRMPYTSLLFLVGAAAIIGLPPLNGFVSEFILYVGLGKSALELSSTSGIVAGLTFALLALAGALALACFAKVFGVAFLGEPRSADAEKAHEVGLSMRAGMTALAIACFVLGVFPDFILPTFFNALSPWIGEAPPEAIASLLLAFSTVRNIALLVLAFTFGLYFLLRRKFTVDAPRTVTWDCGYVAPNARLQYSASSFAEFIVNIFAAVLSPIVQVRRPKEYFPPESTLHSATHDLMQQYFLDPMYSFLEWGHDMLRPLQRGMVQTYVFYVAITLFVLLLANAQL